MIVSIKIKNEVMDALVSKLFIEDTVNYDRRMENSINALKGNKESVLEDIKISLDGSLNITREQVEHYLNKLSDPQQSSTPYISLISDNAVNDLRVIIMSVDDETYKVPLDSLYASSDYFVFDEKSNKYTFFNR